MPFRLRVLSDGVPGTARTFELTPGVPFMVGRKDGADCVLPDDLKISRRHCRFDIDSAGLAIRDLNSKNGFHVNDVHYGGRKGKRRGDGSAIIVPLSPGDRVVIRKFTIEVEESAWPPLAPGQDAPPPPSDEGGMPGRRRQNPERMHAAGFQSAAAPKDAPAAAPLFPSAPAIPGYEILELLGKGGFSEVYLARSRANGADIAIKVLSMERVTDRTLFQREIEIAQTLRHENIVACFDSGQAGSFMYLAMEYMDGGNLQQFLLRHKKMAQNQAMPYLKQILSGLAAIHGHGVIHRDIKPHNVLFDGACRIAKLADFGLAKPLSPAGAPEITKTGSSFGSLNYLPPEQLFDYKRLTPAADIFSLGVVCYEMLSGHSPYEFSREDQVSAVLNHDIMPLADLCPTLDTGLIRLINRALAKEPADRFCDAAAMLAALNQIDC